MSDDVSITHEHHDALDQVLGRHRARTFYLECGLAYGCAYCGAKIGEPCVTDAGLPAPMYQHKSRRSQAFDATRRKVWELTNDIVEDRRASREATHRISMPSHAPRFGLRPKIDVLRESDPIGVRLGLSVARAVAARASEERAWQAIGAATVELADAEAELRGIAASIGVTNIEALLAPKAAE